MGIINKILENNVLFYSIIGVLVLIFLVIIYFAFIYKKKDKNVEEIEVKNDQKEEDILTKEEKLLIKQFKEKDVEKEEIQKVLDQMSEDVLNKKEINIDEFEAMQEENAIISYQELVNNVKSERMEFTLEDVYEEDALEEIKKEENINDLFETKQDDLNELFEEKSEENNFNNLFEEDNKYDDEVYDLLDNSTNFSDLINNEEINEEKIINEVKEVKEPKKYKKSEIISPIYGRQNVEITYPKIETFDRNKEFRDTLLNIEDELVKQPLTDEETKNEEFLNALKEFRRNL